MDVIEEAYQKALEIMKMNITSYGFSASPERHTNYYSVWARDHAISSLAVALTGDKELIETAKRGVLTLLRKQKDHGQVPSYIDIENRKTVYGGLGSITSVDSNMWIVIAAALLYKKTRDKKLISFNNLNRYKRFYRLFKAFDSNDCGLMEVHRAGDWADVFNRTYHVLYDECLYYEALRALAFLFMEGRVNVPDYELKKIKQRIRWVRKRKPWVKRRVNDVFWFTNDNIEKIREEYMIFDHIEQKDYHFYQSHLTPFKITWNNRFETFGNIMAIVTNIAAKERKKRIINYVLGNKINEPVAIKSLHPPVFKRDKEWQSVYDHREKPHTYHNGGIWPMIAGFWIYALSKNKYRRIAKKELLKFAVVMKKQKFAFNEHLHGKSGRPLGRNNQAWSAAGYIIAYHSVKGKINLFDF